MTKGVLGIILCPLVDDNLVYGLEHDPEPKNITIVEDDNSASLRRKLDSKGIPYSKIDWETVKSGGYSPDTEAFNMLIYCINLGLHSKPEELKSIVEGLTTEFQPHVDATGFYLGTCGNYEWDAPGWCKEKGYKPSATFCDKDGCLCHDCVGINIAGGPKYNDLQRAYMGHLYVFPAMATNFDDFMEADAADSVGAMENLDEDMMAELGIEPGKDGYLRWLLSLGDYQYILRINTGLGDQKEFDEEIQKVAERTRLTIKVAEEGWATLQPTIDLYEKCKSLLG